MSFRTRLSALSKQPLFAAAVLAGGVGIVYFVSMRRSFAADVRIICSSEAAAETTIVRGRTAVEAAARKKMESSDGVALLDTLKAAPPDSAARQLRAAADKLGVAECPAVPSYAALATRLSLQHAADRMCSRLEPTILARVPRAKRFARLQDWTHSNVDDPPLDELLKSLAGATLEDQLARLRTMLSDLDIHTCGMLAGLGSPLDPSPGANVSVQSVAVQSDTREAAVADALRAKVPAFRECYEAGLKLNSALAGTMSIKFRLTETGALDFALVQEDSTLTAPPVMSCMVNAVKSASGPTGTTKSPGGLIVVFWVTS